MNRTYRAWVAEIERHHRGIVLGSVLLGVVSAASLMWLRLDMDVLGMLPQGSPAFADFRALVADFGELNELLVLIESEQPADTRRFAGELAARLSGLGSIASVQAGLDIDHILDGILGRYLYNYLPDDDYAELERRLTPAGIEAQVTANRAMLGAPFDLSAARAVMQDPLGVRQLAARALGEAAGGASAALREGYLSSPDGRALLLLARPRAPAFDIVFSERLLGEVRAAEADTRRAMPAAEVRVRYTGSYLYALEDSATLKTDIRRYTGLALVGVLAVFYLGYRNLRILPFVAYPLLLTTVLTFALSLLLFRELNAVSISFAAILYGLSIDSGIYFYTRLLQERQRADRPHLRDAVTATLAGLGRANVAASATTAAAFLVIGLSVLGAVRQLGILTALGMILTTVEFFVLYPALGFLLLSTESSPPRVADTRRLERWARAAAARPVSVAIGAGLLGLTLFLAARQVGLDATLTHLRPRGSEAQRVQDEVAARFGDRGGSGAVLVRGTDLDEALAEGEEIVHRLREYEAAGLVRSVRGVDAVLPSVRKQRARLERFNRLPRRAAIATLRDELARQGFAPARFGEVFEEFQRPRDELLRMDDPALAPLRFLIDHHVRLREGEAIVAVYLEPAPGVGWRALAERLRNDLGAQRVAVAARALLEEELASVLRRELTVFWVLGLTGNGVLLWLGFGSAATAAAILAPVVLVLIGLFAGMWAVGITLDPVNLIVTPLIFGIGVDYGVYIVARAREQGGVPEALRYAGRAVVVTALTTIAGFGFLGLSRYPPLASMGLLAGAGLLLCLVSSIVLLPALLALVPGAPAKPGESAGVEVAG